jgi:glycosyltransferase involved in cell wall biosynthesis
VRVLLVSDYYPPLQGGATRAFQQLADRLTGAGTEVTVVTAWQPGAADVETVNGVSVRRLRDLASRIPGASADPHRHTPPPFPDPELAWRIRRVVLSERPDVIYTFGWITYSLAVALPRHHPPVIFSVRDYGNICAKRSLVRRGFPCSGPGWAKCGACAPELYGVPRGLLATVGVLTGRRLIRWRTTWIQSCSRYAEHLVLDFLSLNGVPVDHRRVIPDFRDEPPATLTAPAGLPSEPFILFVGALREIKGITILLSAYDALPPPKPPLVIIGSRAPDSPERYPAGVLVLDPVPNAQILAAWDRALFGVAPSVLPEPLGNVIHEAMSRQKAVIGTRPGGHEDMITDNFDGLLIPAGDTSALRDAMKLLIEDAQLRDRLAANAPRSAARFTALEVFPRFQSMLSDAAEATQR